MVKDATTKKVFIMGQRETSVRTTDTNLFLKLMWD